jgi:hypothetical protein
VPGAERAGPGPWAPPTLSDAVIQRMKAAVDAAKAESANHDPDAAPIPRVAASATSGDTQTPAVNGTAGAGDTAGRGGTSVVSGVQVKPGRAGRPKRFTRRSGDAAPAGNVSGDRASRLRRTALATGTALTKSGGETRPPAEPDPSALPTRTVPTPARQMRPSARPEAAARGQTVAPHEALADPRPTRLPQRVPSEPKTEPTTGSTHAKGLAPDAPPRPAAKPEPTVTPKHTPPAPSRPQAEPVTPKRTALDPPDAWPPPAIPSGPAAPARLRARPEGTGHRKHSATARVVAVAAVLMASAGVVALIMHATPTGKSPGLTLLQRQTAAYRADAAAWVKTQVSPDTAIACDKQMCSALAASGFSPRYLHVLGPTSPEQVDAALVIETAAVRSLFGTSLNTLVAPAVITTIGSGRAEIAIRIVAQGGVTPYRQALEAGQKARQENEAVLLDFKRITPSAAARKTITAGDADSRLIVTITDLAASEPVDIVDFGSDAINASADLPLRYADLAVKDAAVHMSSSAYIAALRAALRLVPSQYRPQWIGEVRLGSGMWVLRIEEGAPSPLGFTANP